MALSEKLQNLLSELENAVDSMAWISNADAEDRVSIEAHYDAVKAELIAHLEELEKHAADNRLRSSK